MSAKVYAALLAAQKDFGPLIRNATNPHYRSSYADLAQVIETTAEHLQKHGLSVVQFTRLHHWTHEPVLVTMLVHESGEAVEFGEYPLRAKDPDDPQRLGAAMTYARRYTLMAVLGLAPEDDDGNLAAGKDDAPARSTRGGGASRGKSTYKASPNKPPSAAQKNLISALVMQKFGVSDRDKASFTEIVQQETGKTLSELTSADASDFIERLKAMVDAGASDVDEPGY